MNTIIILVGVGVAMAILDFIWFSVAGNTFKKEIGSIARISKEGEWNVAIVPAVLVYVLMGVGVTFFVLPLSTSLLSAACFGALFGFVSYGIYDFTNLATLKAWTNKFAAIDVVWGTILFSLASMLGFYMTTFM